MMLQRRLVTVLVLAVLALSLISARPAAAEATEIVCEGTLALIPSTFLEGEVRMTGERVHIRGRQVSYATDFDEVCPLQLDGTNAVVSNVNWLPTGWEPSISGLGPVWGTFDKQADGHVVPTGFSGSYTGMSTPDGMQIKTVGHGYGEFEGYKVFGEIYYPLPWMGHATMRILVPQGE
jgi:hypothetical protein